MNTTIVRTLQDLMLSGDPLPTPLYIIDKQKLEQNIINLNKEFNEKFSSFIFGYSYKTNYCPAVLKIVHGLGGYAEVVSPMELEIAEQLVKPECIIYNGVIPDLKGKYRVASSGGIVNVENLTELEQLNVYAEIEHILLNVGLRVNIQIDGTATSRFGIEINEQNIRRIQQLRNIKVQGIHCHITKSRALMYWKQKAQEMGKIAKMLDVRYIDFGGNMYGPMNPDLAIQFGFPIPTFSDYAYTIDTELRKIYGNEPLPTVIVEAGTPIISDAMSYLAKAVAMKEVRGKSIITLDGKRLDISVIGDSGKQFPMYQIDAKNGQDKCINADIYGCTCLEFDKFAAMYQEKIGLGDCILFDNVGSYSNVLSPRFIQSTPRIYLYDNGSFLIVKEPDSTKTVFQDYI